MCMQRMTLLQTSCPRKKYHYHEGALDAKDPPRVFIYVIIRSTGVCSEIERQNPQTAASDELTGARCFKKQWVVCCICRQNIRCLRESSNHPQLDKKQVVSQINERNEMWQHSCVEWFPFIATPKGRKEGRKKERNEWQAKLPTSKFKTSVNVSYVWSVGSIEKKQKHERLWECNF